MASSSKQLRIVNISYLSITQLSSKEYHSWKIIITKIMRDHQHIINYSLMAGTSSGHSSKARSQSMLETGNRGLALWSYSRYRTSHITEAIGKDEGGNRPSSQASTGGHEQHR
jgi:hypothetical protein